MLAWETQDDTPYIEIAMTQIADELKLRGRLVFSSFQGMMYDPDTTAQSAILQRAASLKESKEANGYVRLK